LFVKRTNIFLINIHTYAFDIDSVQTLAWKL